MFRLGFSCIDNPMAIMVQMVLLRTIFLNPAFVSAMRGGGGSMSGMKFGAVTEEATYSRQEHFNFWFVFLATVFFLFFGAFKMKSGSHSRKLQEERSKGYAEYVNSFGKRDQWRIWLIDIQRVWKRLNSAIFESDKSLDKNVALRSSRSNSILV